MNEITQQALALALTAAVLLWVNLKAGPSWLKVVTIFPALALLGVAAWLVVDWAVIP